MSYDHVPLDELVLLFVDTVIRSYAMGEDEKLSLETAEIGSAIIRRGEAGATALRNLLNDPREAVQLQAAIELTELDPLSAAPILERLERSAVDPVVGGTAELKLMNNRMRGLLPTR